MKTLVLLAGRSTRFWPLQEKPLFPICGKPLLTHIVDRLRAGGCTDIILVGGAHNLEEAKSLYPDLPMVEQENLDLGMRGALLSALPHCGNEPVMIVGGNDVIEAGGYEDLIATAKRIAASGECSGAILAQKVDRYFPGGYLEVDGDVITSIVEKPGEGNEPSDLVNIVAHIHNDPSALLEALNAVDESRDDQYEQALQKLFTHRTYHAVPYEGTWQAVKYPWHLLQLLPLLLGEIKGQTIHPSVEVHPTAVISGDVVIGEGTKVMPHATIVGPCFIGKNCIVANNSLTRLSSVGDHCIVGYNTEVKASILHSHVWTHMTYIGDSVIGRNVSFGAGSVTGNLRLDEGEISSSVKGEMLNTGLTKFGNVIGNDVQLGIQTSLNPGIKIGSGSFISSASHIMEDVPEKSFARMKDGNLAISENKGEVPQPEERDQYKKKV